MGKRPSLAESMKSVQQPTRPVIVPPAATATRADDTEGEGRRYHAATREGMKRITAPVAPEEHRRLKRLSVDTGRSIEELMREALSDLFAKHRA